MIRALAATAILVLLGAVPAAFAQDEFQLRRAGRVFLDDVVVSPEDERVRLYLRVETLIGEPVDQLTPSSLSIRDGDRIVDPATVELTPLAEVGEGTSAVLVLDTSRTMRGEPFEQAKAAALAFLERMGEFDHVAVVSFDDDVRVIADFGAPRNETRLSLEELEVQPKTLSKMVWDGANRAVELIRSRPPALPRRAFVVVFSDGRDSNSVHGLGEVVALASGGPGEGRVPVFTVGYSRFGGAGLEKLDRLAHGTGAASFQAASPDELGRFFDEIWKRMTGSFVASYGADFDGQRHSIQIGVGDQRDAREVDYPEGRTPVWPWLLGAAVVMIGGAGVGLVLRMRRAGQLVYEGGARNGQVVPLRSGKVRIGALEENDVVLNMPTVSRFHAQLHVRSGKVEIEDLGSKNGTFVNGVAISSRSGLSPGDRLRIGEVDLVYRR